MATAAKAKLLLRELKTVKADLAFAKERCSQLEEENKILREARDKGDYPADDDMVFIPFLFAPLSNTDALFSAILCRISIKGFSNNENKLCWVHTTVKLFYVSIQVHRDNNTWKLCSVWYCKIHGNKYP